MKTRNNNLSLFVIILLVLASCSGPTEKSGVKAEDQADRGAQLVQEKNITDVTVGKPSVTHISENYNYNLFGFAG